jgi:hypothetical protein
MPRQSRGRDGGLFYEAVDKSRDSGLSGVPGRARRADNTHSFDEAEQQARDHRESHAVGKIPLCLCADHGCRQLRIHSLGIRPKVEPCHGMVDVAVEAAKKEPVRVANG